MKHIKRLILFIILILIALVAGAIYVGYSYHKETISKRPIEGKVTEIKHKYSFVPKEELPQEYLKAVVAVEDRRYYSHGAVDIIGIARAIFMNVKNQAFQEGGSTITQQVAKNMYYINEENVIKRKIAEAFTAIELEKKLSKEEILELYANIIYFGDGHYGIGEASQGYLKKDARDMNLAESTMMAGIPNAPSVYAPTVNKALCKSRQKKVISSMVEEEIITKEQADEIDQSFIDDI